VPQFDVFKNPRGGAFPLLLDIQADVLAPLVSRIVVPMAARARYRPAPITRLNPTVTIRGVEYILVFQEMAAVPRPALGRPVATLAARRDDLVAAIDLLFTGI
jgi:toxin CcdB